MINSDHGLYFHCFGGDDCYADVEGPRGTDGAAGFNLNESDAAGIDYGDCCDAIVCLLFAKTSASETAGAYLSI